MFMSWAKYLCLEGCASSTFFIFLFQFFFGRRSISSVSNLSIVSNVGIVRSIIVCSSNLMQNKLYP